MAIVIFSPNSSLTAPTSSSNMVIVMREVNIQQNSSRELRGKTLAPKTLLSALQDFANTGSEPQRSAYFLKRWPGFLEGVIERLTKQEAALSPLARLAYDLQGGKSEFQRLQSYVRAAWCGSEDKIALLLWLAFEEGKSNLVLPDWRRSNFRYEPKTALQAAVYELLKHSREARVCANADCASPYFLTLDPRRKFCSVECTQPAQREWRKRWWARHGKQWRAKLKKRGRSSRRTKR
ncbi:MAG TPA: hypothetical protein VGS59_10005 [Candidatus Acidoferrales bacterium]|nr:hypothetical protein [Candidatus Acidoferrales bacterium]